MHFQIFKDEYYENLILKDLQDKVAEFQSVFDEKDSIYPILGEFAGFMIENSNNSNILKKSFNFINNAIEIGKNKTEDVIVVQIFQPIYNHEQLSIKALDFLSPKALKIFEKFKNS